NGHQRVKRMASMNTRLNIEKLDENIVQKMEVQNKLGSNNFVLMLIQESMGYMMKNVFGLKWNCMELKGIVKLGYFKIPSQDGAKGNAAKGIEKTIMMLLLQVTALETIYAHESLTFSDGVACEVISKWKAGLKKIWILGQICMCSATVTGEAVTTAMTITGMAQRRLEDKQPEENTNTDYLVKEQEKVHHGAKGKSL
nr:hypothetical protein [Tanacetum cinerariifolium]